MTAIIDQIFPQQLGVTAISPIMSHVVLVITAGVLFYAALTDLKDFKIRNELILVLAGILLSPLWAPQIEPLFPWGENRDASASSIGKSFTVARKNCSTSFT